MPVIHQNQPRLLDRSFFRAKMQQKLGELEQAMEALHNEIAAINDQKRMVPPTTKRFPVNKAVPCEHAESRAKLACTRYLL